MKVAQKTARGVQNAAVAAASPKSDSHILRWGREPICRTAASDMPRTLSLVRCGGHTKPVLMGFYRTP